MSQFKTLITAIFALSFACGLSGIGDSAMAQSTSGVTGAKLKANDEAVGYRFGWDPETERFAQRFHYQHSLSDRLRVRVIAVQNNSGGDLRFRSARIETQYQIVRNKTGWNSAVQLQGLIPDGNDGPGRVRFSWINSFDIADGWEARAVILAAREIGDEARDGVFLETRSEATYDIGNGYRFGGQVFNRYNSTASFGDFDDQRHAVGPVLKGKLGDRTSFEATTLFGVSQRAADTTLRLFVTYKL